MLLTASAASAGIVVSVIPDSLNTQPGKNTTYQLRIQSISSETEHGVLSIRDPIPGWTYVFDEPEFVITPGNIIITDLHIKASGSASEGYYYSNISCTSNVSVFREFMIETSFFSFETEVRNLIPFPCNICQTPTDPDGDGKYEDINGNSRSDFNDVVVLFNYIEWVLDNQPTYNFDFNGNERIDFADIIKLFEKL